MGVNTNNVCFIHISYFIFKLVLTFKPQLNHAIISITNIQCCKSLICKENTNSVSLLFVSFQVWSACGLWL